MIHFIDGDYINILDVDQAFKQAKLTRVAGGFRVDEIREQLAQNPQENYLIPQLPVEIHFHGVGNVDFSSMYAEDLEYIEQHCAKQGVISIPTMFLPYDRFDQFLQMMQTFHTAKKAGAYTHIAGIALEGPMLSSLGGTPSTGNWLPTREEWQKIAACGPQGLAYVVLSPDFMLPESTLASNMPIDYVSIDWIIELLLEHHVRPSFGHFQKSVPQTTALILRRLIQLAAQYHCTDFPIPLLTDHIFNDMPHNFKHAWRTSDEKARRNQDIANSPVHNLGWDTLEAVLGEVPAAFLEGARQKLVNICINFDGDHVDLLICQRIVELLNGQQMIVMTDATDTPKLGRQNLHQIQDNSLWYQQDGVVAAGTQHIYKQIKTMLELQIPAPQLWSMVCFNPHQIIGTELIPLQRGQIITRGVFVNTNTDIHPFSTQSNGIQDHSQKL